MPILLKHKMFFKDVEILCIHFAVDTLIVFSFLCIVFFSLDLHSDARFR